MAEGGGNSFFGLFLDSLGIHCSIFQTSLMVTILYTTLRSPYPKLVFSTLISPFKIFSMDE